MQYLSEISDDREKAKHVLKLFEKLKSQRHNWDNYWEQLAQYVLPRKDNVYGNTVQGEDKHNKLYDSTSIHSNELLASALHSMLTNPSSVWFDLSTGDKELDDNKEVRQWMQDAVQKIIKVLNNSNFQEEIHETYLDLGGLGTTTLRIEEDKDDVVRFFSRPVYEAYVRENNKGVIDTLAREYTFDLRQIVMEFGEDVLKQDMSLEQEYEKDNSREYCIVQVIEPHHKNPERYASFHVLKEKSLLLGEGTFNERPFAVPRWTKISGETYGRSPSMKALPDIKMLNQMMRTAIRAAQKAVDPPMMVPDNGFLLPLRTTPGGTNIYRAGTKDRIEFLDNRTRLDVNIEMLEQIRLRVRQAFFIDQLQLQEGPQMTATEVMQRTEEKLRMMGPILGRLNNELLKPIIDRVFGIMLRKGHLGDIPEQISGKDLEIKYISQISKAQRASEADTLTRVLQSVAPMLEAQPHIFDNLNSDEILRYHSKIFGLPEEMLNNRDEVAASRQEAANMQQQQLETEQENMMADTAQKASAAER